MIVLKATGRRARSCDECGSAKAWEHEVYWIGRFDPKTGSLAQGSGDYCVGCAFRLSN
jgi:hypothetical protein